MNRFLSYRSVSQLQDLAKKPFDLRGGLTAERVKSYAMEGGGFRLIYAAERVDERVLAALWELAREAGALEQMRAMQRGDKVNLGEGRAALHTAMRDPGRQDAGRELGKLKKFIDGEGKRFEAVVQVGIGGSDLGPQALYLALEHRAGRRAHFVSNVDPDDANRVLQGLDLAKTLVVVVSKSGTTLETRTNEQFLRDRFQKGGLDPKRHFVAVTGEGSPMDDRGRYLESFYIWDFVGGRYSATSMVGGVMLAMTVGFDVWMEVLAGAHAMDRHVLEEKNVPLLAALLGIWNRNFLGIPSLAVIPYSQALVRFTAHLQQLDMESNGKHVDRQGKRCSFATGPLVWGEVGTNGQHSFYQWIHQGTDVCALEMIGFQESQMGCDVAVEGTTSQQKLQANLVAQVIALGEGQGVDFEGNRPSSVLWARQLTPRTLGALLAYYEHKVVFQGFIWDINSFDQAGVQLGKTLATRILDAMQGKGKFEVAENYLK